MWSSFHPHHVLFYYLLSFSMQAWRRMGTKAFHITFPLIILSCACIGFHVISQMKWFLDTLSHYHGDQWGFKMVLLNVMKVWKNIIYGLIKVHTVHFWPGKVLLMRKQASACVVARAFYVMNSLVAYTLQKEIQHVCQGYLGKSHSLVCGSVAFYYLPQSFKSNSIFSLLPGPSSVSAERTLDRQWCSLLDGTTIACRWL